MPKHMKGLQNFLAELRKCKTTIEETSRINREIDHIKSRFEGKGSINGYQRRKYVCKLVYIALIGFDIETLGCNEAIELISSTKFSEKQMGYLFLSLTDKYLTVQSQLLQLLHHDLTSNNALANELATSYLANAGDLNLGKATAKEVLSLALDGKRTAVVRTKAILCLEHAYKLGAFQVDGESAYGLVRLLHDPHPSVVRCAVSLHSALLCETVFRVVCQKAAPDYAKFLVKVGMSANLDEYAYRNIPDPWLQLDLLRVLRVLEPLQSLSSERTEMIAYFRTFFERAAQDPVRVAKGTSSMFNIRESVLTDIVRVLMLYPDEQDTIRQCVSLLGEMLCTRMLNVRLIVLELFLQVIKLDFCLPLVKKFDDEIRKTLQAKDDTLRIVTAELVVELSVNDDQASRKAIATEMLGFIETVDPPERRHVLAAKLAEMASTIKADAKWHMKSMMRAFDNSGDRTVSEKLVKGVMQTIVDNESLHSDAARLCFSCMRGGQGGEPMLRLCCLVLPVFGHHVVRAGTASPEVIFTTMSGRVQNLGTNASEHTLSAYIASCTKFVSHFPAIKGLVDDAVVNSTALAEYEKQMYQSLASTMPNREQVSQQQREEQQIRQAERREQEAQQAAVAAHATRAAEPAAPEPELRQTEPEPAVTQEEASREETPTQAPLPYENAPATAAQHSSDSINRQNVPSSGGLYDDE